MPTIGSEPLTATKEAGFRADSVPFVRSKCGKRGARTALLAGRLPAFFFATHHPYLSLRRTKSTRRASSAPAFVRVLVRNGGR